MSKKRMDVNWKRETGKEDLKPAVKRYRRYLEDKGLRPSSIPMCVLHVGKYLEFSGTDAHSVETLPGSATISMTQEVVPKHDQQLFLLDTKVPCDCGDETLRPDEDRSSL